jgi:hypothetical protein
MRLRKNLRTLFAEYNAAAPADRPSTELMRLKAAILALKNPATHPSQLISRGDVQAAIASDIAGGMLGPGSTLKTRYDDFVWAHHQVMMLGPNASTGPNWAHRGPAFGPWHRELLKLYEAELAAVAGDPDLTLPYWDWTKDRSTADPGFPFVADFLGGDGAGNPNDRVTTGDFAGLPLNCDEEGFGYLRRHFGIDGPGLPTSPDVRGALALTTYDSSPWNLNSPATSFRNTLEGWVGTGQIHNAVHRWVNGSMQPGSSPNDPVFFLHHCNIDRLWSVWQQKHPGSAGYLPDMSTPASAGLTRLMDRMSSYGRTATDRYFGLDVIPADVLNSKAITWYDSDLPELSNETGATLSFIDIPEGLTSYKAVTFRITGGRPVHFRLSGLPAAPFGLTTMGTEFLATPDPDADFYYGHVWLKLDATAGPVTPSAVDIHAYLVDEEGYFAATAGGEYPLGDFHLNLTASTVPRQNNSVVLVLDRSGSMADPAGGTSTKSGLLKNAVGVFNSLMLGGDEIALVSFDDQVATPAPIQAVAAGAVPAVLAGSDLDPRGLTCIGGGIQQGATQLGLAGHSNRSMLVLTDGVQNVHPYVADLPAGTITNRTYAIGFGLPADISTAVLRQITFNTHGDLIITGNISTDEQRFNLTKYFVQLLAGVTNMDVILDPQGLLFAGSRQSIPFQVTAADVYLDVIALSPLPQLVGFSLITPAGTVITPSSGDPNVEYLVRPDVAFYRVTLPAIPDDPAGSHAGTWQAVLELGNRRTAGAELRKLLADSEQASPLQNGGLPYSLVAHAYSNLRFAASLYQEALRPGSIVTIRATLTEYDVPFDGPATVWVEITAPDQRGGSDNLQLTRTATGRYEGSFTAVLPGIYGCRVRATGSVGNDPFTREKTLTAATFVDSGRPSSQDGHGSDHGPDGCCLDCLLADGVLTERAHKRLQEWGIDLAKLRECADRNAGSAGRPEKQPGESGQPGRAGSRTLRSEPKARRLSRPPVEPVPMAADAPVVDRPRVVHMHTPEAEFQADRPLGFPRIVTMFSRDGE